MLVINVLRLLGVFIAVFDLDIGFWCASESTYTMTSESSTNYLTI
jgi:hypothetical protein